MILAIYDLSGIQSYVFATNKLREMIGASEIIHKALFMNIPQLLGENEDEWITSPFTFTDKSRTVYIGGGNALVAFTSDAEYKRVTRELQKRIFEQAGGALKLCSAYIVADDTKSLAENQKILMDKLDKNKRVTPAVSTAPCFSINEYDNITFEPVLLFDNRYTTRSEYLKNEAYKAYIKSADASRFTTDVDDFKKTGESKNYVAVIHIDGNTMGMQIRNFVQNLPVEAGQIANLDKLKLLSSEINKKFEDVLTETINGMYGSGDDKILFRRIIADGDDITVICEAEKAIDFVAKFCDNLTPIVIKPNTVIKVTAGAGIAFVKLGFPFYLAYEFAEQCCKNAKKETISRDCSGDNAKSSFDYQMIYGGITGDIPDFREHNYCFEHGENKFKLIRRPYIFGANEPEFDYEKGFKTNLKLIFDALKNKFARSKLKGLRNAYGQGYESAVTFGEYLAAREHNGKNNDFASKLSSVFDSSHYAPFFDVLDILDLLKPELEPESEVQINADK
ncbi:hypothetical protein FACS1894105_00490 [Clostridia bacterium]|nr:hypothetical protein FACS1894105_00490 [Clostridia bacterium]